MKFNSAIAASILAFCASASAWTEEEYGLYAREAGLVDQDYDYEYDLYGREAEPEAEFDFDYGVDHLHPRDAYEYGLYMGELQARAVPAKPAAKVDKKAELKAVVHDTNKAGQLKAKEDKQRAQLKKDMDALRDTKKAEKSNSADLAKHSKKLGARSFDWQW